MQQLHLQSDVRNFPGSLFTSRLIRVLVQGSLRDYREVYSNMKVQPMRGLVGNTLLIIAKTAVIASLLKLLYSDLTCSFANTRFQ